MTRLELAREVAMSHLGRPYKWGGDNPMEGFDCSGLAIEILKSVGLFPRRGDTTARGLKGLYRAVATPRLGCLVFYGDPAIHVEFCLDHEYAIGASGGRSTTTDEAAAIAADAYIKIRPWDSRDGVSGFVDPFEEDR